MSTSLNGDAILGWLTSSGLDDGRWNQTQGEHITFYADKIDKFNEMCPDSEINDMQGVRMLQNSIANVPNLANVLLLYRQTKTSAGQSDKITLRQFVSLLAQQAQVYDSGRICTGRNYCQSAATHELDYEINAHDFDQDKEEDLDPDEWFDANGMNQQVPRQAVTLETGMAIRAPDSRRPRTTSAKQIKYNVLVLEPSWIVKLGMC